MTKVQVEYQFDKPLDEGLLDEIALAHSVYGLARLQLSPALDRVLVDYDASRLTPAQVEAVLRRLGLPIRKAAAA
ncbi:MAG: hypothetical protein NTY38_24230 [Acidobacteria bacterium]|nr:hypothetical protein [Acidobacteriota bacterium]